MTDADTRPAEGAVPHADKPTLGTLFSERPRNFLHMLWIVAVTLTALGLMAAALRQFPISEVWAGLMHAKPAWLGVTVVALVMGQLLRCARWHELLQQDVPISLPQTGRSLMDGQLINWLSPVRLGDVWRAWQAAHTGQRSALWAAASIALEKTADSLVLALFALSLFIAPPPIQTYSLIMRLGLGAMTSGLMMIVILALRPGAWRGRALARLPAPWRVRVAHDLSWPLSIDLALHSRALWIKLFAYTVAIWGLAVATNIALARAFDTPLTVMQHIFLLLALQMGVVISVIPANIGLFPLVTLGVFAIFGMEESRALIYGSALYALVYGTNLCMWVIWRVMHRMLQKPLVFAQQRARN